MFKHSAVNIIYLSWFLGVTYKLKQTKSNTAVLFLNDLALIIVAVTPKLEVCI